MKKIDKRLKALKEKEAKINSESLKNERFKLFNNNNREKHLVDQEKEVDTSSMDCTTLNPTSIRLDPTTQYHTRRVGLASVGQTSSMDCTTLYPTSMGCTTLDPTSIRLDSTTKDPTSRVDPAIVDQTSSIDSSTLDPTSTSCLEDIEVLRTRNKKPEEVFSHPNRPLETGNEYPEEDFSRLSAEEQAVLSSISKIINGTLFKC
jgi:hypothetical protein